MLLLRKTSLVDYPGIISSVLFFSGCNLRCPWCHNGELARAGAENLISIDDAFTHLKKRRFVIKGVVLSGGEPCLQERLPEIIEEIKNLGLRVKLDTNGLFPTMLEKLFSRQESRPDYIALDLKIAPLRYCELSPDKSKNNTDLSRNLGAALTQSARLIRESGIAHEYRSLALPNDFFTEKDVEALAPLVDNSPWYFRPFKGGSCLDPAWDKLEEPSAQAQARLQTLGQKAKDLGGNGIA